MSDAMALLAMLVTDTGQRWGDLATDWQLQDAESVLEPGAGPRQFWLGRPKGGSKTSDVAGFALAWLICQAPELSDGYVISADLDQSNRLLDRMRGYVQRTPGLGDVVKVGQKRVVNQKTEAKVHALPADVPGSEGILSPFLVCEEMPNWSDIQTARNMWTVAVSTLPKWPGARLTVIGHAGDPAHWSHRVLEHARASDAWLVHEIPGPLEWVSADALEEQKLLLLPSEYRRRHLNEWVPGEDRLTTLEDVRACIGHSDDLPHEHGKHYVCSLDVGLTNDRTCAVIAHSEDRPAGLTVVVDRIAVWQGRRGAAVDLDSVEAWVAGACTDYYCSLTFDPFQAKHLAQRLEAKHVRTEQFTFSTANVGRLAVTLYRLLKSHLLDLPDDRELIDELVNTQLREVSPGSYRIDHASNRHDDRAIATAMAAAWLIENAVHGEVGSLQSSMPFVARPRDDQEWRLHGGFDPRTSHGLRPSGADRPYVPRRK